MPCASVRTIERRREISYTRSMKRMLILTVILWLGVSAIAHAQVNSPTNAASTVTAAIVPSDQGVTFATGAGVSSSNAASMVTAAVVPFGQGVTFETGGGFSSFVSAPLLCPFGPSGVSLSVMLTPFLGCASDPLSATYQSLAAPAVMTTAPVVSISANARTATTSATSGAGSTAGGVSSSVTCVGAIPSTAGGVGAGDLFGDIGVC
jgi:hypothetical protein